MSSSALTLISKIDRNNCNRSQKKTLEKLDTTLAEAVRLFVGSAKPISSAAGPAKDVLFSQAQSSQVPTGSGKQGGSAEPNPPSGGPKQKGRKLHNCHKCTFFSYRKADLEDHLGFKHKIGKLHMCFIGKCKGDGLGAQMSSQKNLKQHIRQQH